MASRRAQANRATIAETRRSIISYLDFETETFLLYTYLLRQWIQTHFRSFVCKTLYKSEIISVMRLDSGFFLFGTFLSQLFLLSFPFYKLQSERKRKLHLVVDGSFEAFSLNSLKLSTRFKANRLLKDSCATYSA